MSNLPCTLLFTIQGFPDTNDTSFKHSTCDAYPTGTRTVATAAPTAA